MNKVKWSLIGVLLFGLVFSGMAAGTTKLVFPVHWGDYQLEGVYDEEENLVEKGLNQYVEEYIRLNPDIEIEIQAVLSRNICRKYKLLKWLVSVQIYSRFMLCGELVWLILD